MQLNAKARTKHAVQDSKQKVALSKLSCTKGESPFTVVFSSHASMLQFVPPVNPHRRAVRGGSDGADALKWIKAAPHLQLLNGQSH